MNKGQTEREVYLPKGTWISVIDRKAYEGGKKVTARAGLNQFIAFVKEGSQVLEVFP